MSLLNLLKRKEPTPEELEAEALHVSELMTKAEEGSFTKALDRLKEVATIAKKSPQKDIYELDDIQEVLGQKVYESIAHAYPEHFQLSFVQNMRINPPQRELPSLEQLAQRAVEHHAEAANGLIDEDKVRAHTLARLRKGRVELEEEYQNLLKKMAVFADHHLKDIKFPFPVLVADYEANLQAYALNFGLVQLPTLSVTDGKGGKAEVTSSRIVYRAALQNTLHKSETYLGTAEAEAHFGLTLTKLTVSSDEFGELLEKFAGYCAKKGELTGEEKERAEKKLNDYTQRRETLLQTVADLVDSQHSEYMDTLDKAASIEKKVEAFNQLMSLTLSHRKIIDMEPGEMLQYGEKCFEEMGASLQLQGKQIVVRTAEGKVYETEISRGG